MDLGIQHAFGSAAVHDLECICDHRYIECLRTGESPDADMELEYWDRLVREVSIGVNQVVFNLENLAGSSRASFTHTPRPDSPLFYGICGATTSSNTNINHQKGWGICNLGPLVEELEDIMSDATCSLQGALDQGIPLPPLPCYPSWYLPCRPQSPSPTSSTGIPTESWETSTQMLSPPCSCSSSPNGAAGARGRHPTLSRSACLGIPPNASRCR